MELICSCKHSKNIWKNYDKHIDKLNNDRILKKISAQVKQFFMFLTHSVSKTDT